MLLKTVTWSMRIDKWSMHVNSNVCWLDMSHEGGERNQVGPMWGEGGGKKNVEASNEGGGVIKVTLSYFPKFKCPPPVYKLYIFKIFKLCSLSKLLKYNHLWKGLILSLRDNLFDFVWEIVAEKNHANNITLVKLKEEKRCWLKMKKHKNTCHFLFQKNKNYSGPMPLV